MDYSPWGHKESDTTKQLIVLFSLLTSPEYQKKKKKKMVEAENIVVRLCITKKSYDSLQEAPRCKLYLSGFIPVPSH